MDIRSQSWLKIEEQASNINSLIGLKDKYKRLQGNLSDIKSLVEQRLGKLNTAHQVLFEKIELDNNETILQTHRRTEKSEGFRLALEALKDELSAVTQKIKDLDFAAASFKEKGVKSLCQ